MITTEWRISTTRLRENIMRFVNTSCLQNGFAKRGGVKAESHDTSRMSALVLLNDMGINGGLLMGWRPLACARVCLCGLIRLALFVHTCDAHPPDILHALHLSFSVFLRGFHPVFHLFLS